MSPNNIKGMEIKPRTKTSSAKSPEINTFISILLN
jgi:hypothetical protein